MASRGPRPEGANTRAAIVISARTQYATKGYVGASMRGIAREAGVDPALVHHYFASKPALFISAVLSDGDEPFVDPAEVVRRVVDGPVEELGQRWIREFVNLWDNAGPDRFRALIQGVVAQEEALGMLKQFLSQELLGPLVAQLGVDRPQLRTQLAATQLVGLAMGRYVVEFPEIANLSADECAAWIGPNLQSYLVEPLRSEPAQA